MVIALLIFVLGLAATTLFFAIYVDHFELYSTGWDVFLVLGFLSALTTIVAALVIIVVLVRSFIGAIRRPPRASGTR